MPRASGIDAGECVLEHGCLGWLDAEEVRRSQERVGRGFAGEMLSLRDQAVDASVEQSIDARRLQYLFAVLARRHDGGPESAFANCFHVSHGALI